MYFHELSVHYPLLIHSVFYDFTHVLAIATTGPLYIQRKVVKKCTV